MSKRTASGTKKVGSSQNKSAKDNFISNEAWEAFNTRYKNKTFAGERGWDFTEFTGYTTIRGMQRDINWKDEMEKRSMIQLLEFDEGYVPVLVKEFFANVTERSREKGKEIFVTTVRKKKITVTADTFVEIFGLVRPKREIIVVSNEEVLGLLCAPGTKQMENTPIGCIVPDYLALAKSIGYNVCPSAHDNEIEWETLKVIYQFASLMDYDVPRNMIVNIVNVLEQDVRAPLLYPGIITRIIREAGVNLSGFTKEKRFKSKITSTLIRKALAARGQMAPQPAPPPVLPLPPPVVPSVVPQPAPHANERNNGDVLTPAVMVDSRLEVIEEQVRKLRCDYERIVWLLEDSYRVRQQIYPQFYIDAPASPFPPYNWSGPSPHALRPDKRSPQ